MAVEVVASASSFSSTVSVPDVVAGDLIVLLLLRNSSSSQPANPSGFTSLYTASGSRLAYKVATEDAASGSVSSAYTQAAITVVYRGVNVATPFSATQFGGRASRSSFTVSERSESSPSASLFALLFCASDGIAALTPPPLPAFVTESHSAAGYAGHLAASSLTGGSVTMKGSYVSTWAVLGLVPAESGGGRQRSRLILTPW